MKIFFGERVTIEKNEDFFNSLTKNLENSNKDIYIYFGYPIIESNKNKSFLKSLLVCDSGIYVYYDNEEEKMLFSRFITRLITDSSDIYNLYNRDKNIMRFYNKTNFEETISLIKKSKCILTKQNLTEFNAIIQKTFGFTNKDDRHINKPNSLGDLIQQRNNRIYFFDDDQFKTVYQDKNTHLRITGLAGSGKTILLVKKMAYLHFLHPELTMAYVFFTLSLKQFIEDLFMRFYRDFDNVNNPDFKKIHILHSWGRVRTEGFYSSLCKEFGVQKRTISDVPGKVNKFAFVCNELFNEMKEKKINKGIYDKIFIDEGQDFPLEFYKLAKSVLNPSGTIIYAYDELQSLNDSDTAMPTKKEIFGDEPCDDINLKICYRTPNQILITAHALGLGVYNIENGQTKWANMIQDLSTRKNTGYEIESGILDYGKAVTLTRKNENFDQYKDPIIFLPCNSDIEQYEIISKEIHTLITQEDIKPEDILIIDLDSISLNDDFNNFDKEFSKFFVYQNETSDSLPNVNIVNKDHALKFRKPNSIPFTTIFRAKGNEANIVFILNAHKLSNIYSFTRNKIFTAMTRSKFRVYISGTDAIEKYINEYNIVKENKFKLSFTYPTKSELNDLKIIAKKDSENITTFETIIENFKKIKDSPELIKELLLSQTGQSNVEGLRDFIENLFGDKSNE